MSQFCVTELKGSQFAKKFIVDNATDKSSSACSKHGKQGVVRHDRGIMGLDLRKAYEHV